MSREQFRPLIHQVARDHGIPSHLFEAMIEVESNFRPDIVSVSGAVGLCQVIPKWHMQLVARVAREQGRAIPEPFTVGDAHNLLLVPEVNLVVGARYLRDSYNTCGDWQRAIARYHSGRCDPPADTVDGAGVPTTRHVQKVMTAWERLAQEGKTMTTLVFGNVQHPPFLDRLIPDSQTSAWDNLGQRQPVGVCQHSMVGTLWGTDGYFRRGRDSVGLTDYGIGGSTDGERWDGVIIRWNDPLGRAHTVTYDKLKNEKVSPNRAGWANGPASGLEGDGPLFVRTLGINAVNRDLVSIERSDGGNINTPMSTKQFASIVALTAHWFDYAKVPWDRFPLNPKHGIVTHMLHKEFSTKDCPFPPVYNRINEIQDAVRGLLRAGQTQSEGAPVPPVQPPQPDHEAYPNGWLVSDLRERFGLLERRFLDGRTQHYPFDPKGVISNAWVSRGIEKGYTRVRHLPRPVSWYDLEGGTEFPAGIVLFEKHWALYRPAAPVAWRWVR